MIAEPPHHHLGQPGRQEPVAELAALQLRQHTTRHPVGQDMTDAPFRQPRQRREMLPYPVERRRTDTAEQGAFERPRGNAPGNEPEAERILPGRKGPGINPRDGQQRNTQERREVPERPVQAPEHLLEQFPDEIPARVRIGQGIVQHVAVPVVTLREVRELYDRVRLHEPAQPRVINTPVHVDNPHRIHHLMAGEPAGGAGDIKAHPGQGRQVPPGRGMAPLPPGVITQLLHDDAQCIGDDTDAAQVVPQEVLRGHGLRLGAHPVLHDGLVFLGNERRPAGDITLVLIQAAGVGHLLHAPHIQGRGALIVRGRRRALVVRVRALEAGPLGAVGEACRMVALDDALYLAERGVGQRAPGPGQLVAGGVIGIGVAPRRGHRMGTGVARAVAVAAHPGLALDIAQGVIRHGLRRAGPYTGGGQAVEGVIRERLRQVAAAGGVRAPGEIPQHVPGVTGFLALTAQRRRAADSADPVLITSSLACWGELDIVEEYLPTLALVHLFLSAHHNQMQIHQVFHPVNVP